MKLQERNPALTFICPKDVNRVLSHITSYMGAYYHLRNIKKCLGKQKHQGVTVKEFAEWEGLDIDAVQVALYTN